ncbi:MAG: MMPL family transporter [Propionibacteriaceae bacterium]
MTRRPAPVRVAAALGHRLGRVYRAAVTTGRWVVLGAWIAAAVLVNVLAPAQDSGGGGFGDLLPPDSQVLQVEQHILREFRVPVLAGTSVVLHQTDGLSVLTQADSLLWALATTQGVLNAPHPPVPGQVIAAIPVPTGTPNTTVTYLFMSEGTGLYNTVRLANQYAAHFNNQAEANTYVTGFVPAQVAQGTYLRTRLPLFELASVVLIVSVVAFAFRSLLAPLVVVGVAAVGYLVYFPLLSNLAEMLGFEVPNQLEPVLLALLLGLVTDYCVLFFSAFRDQLDRGHPTTEAAHRALKDNAPVIAVAGMTVAGGTIALLAAPFEIFRALGPALALTVLVGLAICLTLTPALMTILSWRLFVVLPVRGSGRAQRRLRARHQSDRIKLIDRLVHRPAAVAAAAAVIVLLGLATVPLAQARLDLSFTAGLPSDHPVSRGAQFLDAAGLRGISAPTEIMLEADGVTDRRADLIRMQGVLATQPGVAKVLGPADLPRNQNDRGLVLSTDGNAARFVVIFNSDPLAAQAVEDVRTLQSRLGSISAQAGLGDTRQSMTGQTLIASEVAELTRTSLQVTLLVALSIELLILVIYLRAVVAPLVLLASSALSVAAALGLTTLVFQEVLGEQGLTFYAPFASAILLIALGADYTVFSVGSIWIEARRRPLAEALRIAVPRSSEAITTAGVILAGTFALVALIPLSTFRQIAFAMSVGLLIDTLVIRPILTPALLTLLGRTASWPSRRVTVAPPRARRSPVVGPADPTSTRPRA